MTNMRESGSNGYITNGPDHQDRFLCKLFDDMIIREVCVLRKRELDNRNRFSCEGCIRDAQPVAARAGLNLCALND